MTDTALPTLKQTAVEFLIQTNHQPLYYIAEQIIEREQQCTQLGYDRAIAELTDKLSKQEHEGVQAQTPATDTEPPAQDSQQLVAGESLGSWEAAAIKTDRPVGHTRIRITLTQARETGLHGDTTELEPTLPIDTDLAALSAILNRVVKTTCETFEEKSSETAYERDQRFQDAYLAVPSDVRGNYPLFEEFKRVLERKRTPMEKWRETAKVGSKTLTGDGATKTEMAAPDPERFQGLVMGDWVGIARRLWQLLDNIDTLGDQIKPSDRLDQWRLYFEAIQRLHAKRHLELESDGYVLTPFTASSYEVRPTLNNVTKSLNTLSKRDGLSLPARREQLEIMLSRGHINVKDLAHAVLQLIALQGF